MTAEEEQFVDDKIKEYKDQLNGVVTVSFALIFLLLTYFLNSNFFRELFDY